MKYRPNNGKINYANFADAIIIGAWALTSSNDRKKMEEYVMTINKNVNGTECVLTLTGRLDTTTAPQLEAEINATVGGITLLTLDFEALEYLSSAGLRVILSTQKTMNKQGKMVIKHVNETIMEVFEVTGFVDILTIQ